MSFDKSVTAIADDRNLSEVINTYLVSESRYSVRLWLINATGG